jgi:3-deoxy-manno-octulosonate cytidylyltransferase (CMP-KDO synthetase)
MKEFFVVIPARYASQRLPGKPLRDIAGKPMLQHVYERGVESGAAEVVIATDDDRILAAAKQFSARCCMTSASHQSGTDRLAEVARKLDWDTNQVIVNLQGDEPLMPPRLIAECAELLSDGSADVATLASPILAAADFTNPNVVKVVTDAQSFALYFSRAPLPYCRNEANLELARASALHHHGIYAYRNSVLQLIVSAAQADIEICEQLEQLRMLALGMKIIVARPSQRPGPGVDTEDDLTQAAQLLANVTLNK